MRVVVLLLLTIPLLVHGQSAPSREYIYLNGRLLAVDGPPAPGIALSGNPASSTAVNLSWSYSGFTPTAFRIEWKEQSSQTWSQKPEQNVSPPSGQVGGLISSTPYNFRVIGLANPNITSNVLNVTTPVEGAPIAPTCTNAIYWSNIPGITIYWNHDLTNVTNFQVQRKIGANGTWADLTTTGPTTLYFTDTALDTGTTYYYQVRTYNNGMYSPYCNPAVSASTPGAPGGAPSTPNLTNAVLSGANCNSNPFTLTLTWTANPNDGHTHIVAYTSPDTITWTYLSIWPRPGEGEPNIKVLNASDGLSYGNRHVRIHAYKFVNNEDVFSSPSNARPINAAQTVPTQVSATSQRFNGQPRVAVAWTLPPAPFGVHHYRLTRIVDNVTTTVSIACNAASYVDTSSIANNKAYVYKMQAVDKPDNQFPTVSGFSNADYATTVDFVPSINTGVLISADHINSLRNTVNYVRSTTGAGIFTGWTDQTIGANLVVIQAAHIKELRFRLKEALLLIGAPLPNYTDPTPDPGAPGYDAALRGVVVKKEHFNQLRAAVKPITY